MREQLIPSIVPAGVRTVQRETAVFHVDRLKLLKRLGYGRATFDVLRLRVLRVVHHAEPTSAISSTPLVNTQQRLLVCGEVA